MKRYPSIKERLSFDPEERLGGWIDRVTLHSQLDKQYARFWLTQALMVAYEAGQRRAAIGEPRTDHDGR